MLFVDCFGFVWGFVDDVYLGKCDGYECLVNE